MPIPRATIIHIAHAQRDSAIARGDFLKIQGECYRRYGTDPARLLNDADRRLLARLGKAAQWRKTKRDLTIVSLKTLKRWWKQLIDDPPFPTRNGGKPRTDAEIEELAVELALTNSWGDGALGRRSIAGELAKIGITIHDTTVRAILRRHGVATAPQRGRGRDDPQIILTMNEPEDDERDDDPSIENLVAIDFLLTPCLTATGIICFAYALIAIHQPSRRAALLGVRIRDKGAINADFLNTCADQLIGPEGFLAHVGTNVVLMDNDSIYRDSFLDHLRQAGVTITVSVRSALTSQRSNRPYPSCVVSQTKQLRRLFFRS